MQQWAEIQYGRVSTRIGINNSATVLNKILTIICGRRPTIPQRFKKGLSAVWKPTMGADLLMRFF